MILQQLYNLENDDEGQNFFADSAYVGDTVFNVLDESKMTAQIMERAYRGKPLTEEQQQLNKFKSKVRVRAEHIYAFMEMSMNRMFCRRIGFIRNAHFIGMRNFVYNIMRYVQLVKYA